jgi:hypothetical protein
MAKRRYAIDEAKIARFEKEGRGRGSGADYLPWLTIQDVPSSGRRSRVFTPLTGREHHLLSDIETSVFFVLHWHDDVVDLREQFPLDRSETRRIAAELDVPHPKDRHTGVDTVMTLDLLVDVRTSASPLCVPVSCKPFDDLEDRRTLEKLEIERLYCRKRWGTWHLMTDRDYSKVYVQNLRWVHEMCSLENLDAPHPQYWADCCESVLRTLRSSPGKSLRGALDVAEASRQLRPGDALTAFRHLLAKKVVTMDLLTSFDDHMPVAALTLKSSVAGTRSAA